MTLNKPKKKTIRTLGEFPDDLRYLPKPKEVLFPLPRATKKAWLRELRSGDFQQCRGHFRNDNAPNSFDAMGLLLNIIDMKAWTMQNGIYSWNGFSSLLDPDYSRWSEYLSKTLIKVFQQEVPIIKDSSMTYQIPSLISSANDNGTTFNDIAIWIERYL